jgi:hypothetical protein
MMHLNRLLTRRQIVELNDLSPEDEMAIFSLLRPLQGMGEAAKYLESQVDRVIEVVRLGGAVERIGTCEAPSSAASQHEDRPPPDPRRCVQEPEHHQKEEGMGHITQPSWAETVHCEEPKPVAAPVELLLVDEKGAGLMLGVSRRTVFDLNKQGALRSKQIGKRKLYLVADLRAFASGEAV